MKLVDFWEGKPTYEDIDKYYVEMSKYIDNKFDKNKNNNYQQDFALLTDDEIESLYKQQKTELSTQSGLMLLAFIETLFRTDLIRRIENRKGIDNLSKYYKNSYNPAMKIYHYGMDSIFEGWKNHYGNLSKKMSDILNTLPQYFEYRNWIAHGRYWRFKESNYEKKYNYQAIQILLENIIMEFNGKLKK